ncbi:MAG: glutamyl-tRNA reductase [bacterium]|nr:glutamyl-tRNA reductase [bacterium]
MTGATTLHVRSINHKTAPTAVRERAHLTEVRAAELMDALSAGSTGAGGGRGEPDCVSVIPVSTCNRTEIYLEVRVGADPDAILREALTAIGAEADLFFGEHALRLDNLDAIAHLFRLASGMESLMLGEPQITAQLKDAYRQARAHHEPGPGLLRAFQGAFRAGKRVRTETRISTGAVSVAFAAVELARKFFDRFSRHRAVLVGAGETGALAARHFLQHEIGQLTVVNRSFERAQALAATLREEQLRQLDEPDGDDTRRVDRALRARADRIVARPWEELGAAIAAADVVLTTTGATEPVIMPDMVHEAVRGRHGLPLFMLDIAVPRDVHPEVSKIGNVFVFGLEDLDEIVQGNLAARRNQIPHAERLIGEELDEFRQWLEDIDLRPTVAEFRAYLEDLKDKQVGFVRKKHSDEVADEVDKSLQQFIKKVLGRSMSTLRNSESREERQRHLETLRHLFSTDDRDPD